MDLTLMAKSANRFEEMAEHIRQVADVGAEILPADLSQAEDVLRVCEYLIGDERPMGLFVNNAGFGFDQDSIGGGIECELDALNVMACAVFTICHAAIPNMVARGGGGILDITSMAALMTQGTCSMHKAQVRTFIEGSVASSKGTGVNVTVVCPGLTHAELHEKVDVDPGQWFKSAFILTERMAAGAIGGARRGKVVVTLSRRCRMFAGTPKTAPQGLVRAVAGSERSDRRS